MSELTREDREKFRVRADEAEGALASATDLLNSWARESNVVEACDEREIKTVINRLWDQSAMVRMERDALRAAIEKAPHGLDCDSRLLQINFDYGKCDCWKAVARG